MKTIQWKWAIAFIVLLAYGCKKESISLLNANSHNNEIIKLRGGSYSRMARFDNEPVLREAFNKYARYFGMTGTWSDQTREEFKRVLIEYLQNGRNITVIRGSHKSTRHVMHYYNNTTRIDVITSTNNQNLIAIKQLGAYQLACLKSWGFFLE